MSPELFARYLDVARDHGVTSARIVVEGGSVTFTLGASTEPAKTADEIADALGAEHPALYGSAG